MDAKARIVVNRKMKNQETKQLAEIDRIFPLPNFKAPHSTPFISIILVLGDKINISEI